MKILIILTSFIVLYISVNALPAVIKNDPLMVKKNGISLQKTMKYDFKDDSVQTLCCIVDSVGYDKQGRILKEEHHYENQFGGTTSFTFFKYIETKRRWNQNSVRIPCALCRCKFICSMRSADRNCQ